MQYDLPLGRCSAKPRAIARATVVESAIANMQNSLSDRHFLVLPLLASVIRIGIW